MKLSLIKNLAIATLLATISTHAMAQYGGGVQGSWSSSEGTVLWQGNGSASYKQDGGKLRGQFNNSRFTGFWIENSSSRKCSSKKHGSFHWGRAEFDFNADLTVFNGRWGYCEAAPTAGWSGKKIGAVIRPAPATGPKPSPQECTQLEYKTRRSAEALRKEWADWERFEQDYLNFYDGSKFTLASDFDKIYYELPSAIPYSSSINKVFRVERNQQLRHFPQVKITAPPDYQNAVLDALSVLSDLLSVTVGMNGLIADIYTKITKWNEFMGEGRREKTLPFDQGVKTYSSMMTERQQTLDNFRKVINHFYCKKVIEKERELFLLRTKTIANSQCPGQVKEAMTGFAVRYSKYRNAEQFRNVDRYCSAI